MSDGSDDAGVQEQFKTINMHSISSNALNTPQPEIPKYGSIWRRMENLMDGVLKCSGNVGCLGRLVPKTGKPKIDLKK